MLKEKDQQIEELTSQTNQYVNEMEANAALIEDLRAELSRGRCFYFPVMAENSLRIDIFKIYLPICLWQKL